LTHDKICNGSWDQKNATAYMRVHCLNTNCISEVIRLALNCKLYSDADAGKEANPELFELYQEESEDNPENYKPFPIPFLWNCDIPIEIYVDAIMHLMFLGVVRTTRVDVQEWLKSQGKLTSLFAFCKDVLDQVKGLSISWCCILPYSKGSFGGWVYENYYAFARLFRWFYSPLLQFKLDTPYNDPESPQSTWTEKQKHAWLSARELNVTKGNAKQFQEQVASSIIAGAPPITPERGVIPDPVNEFINRLSNVVALRMSTCSDEEHVKQIELHIQLFLSRDSVNFLK
jgi:hypothetical protein